MNTTAVPRLPWYFTPVVVIVAGCLVAVVNFGIRSSFGFFTAPLSEAHGWPRETFSFAMAMQNLLWGLATPVAGTIADRYGAARVLIFGALLYSAGVLMMAFTTTPLLFNLGGGILVGIGIAFSSFSIVMAAFGRIVPPEKRSWAFGIATASGSLGQFIFAPATSLMVTAYGWQTGLVMLAMSTLLIIPFALSLLVQNSSGLKKTADSMELSLAGAVREAFAHRSYILLTAGFFVCGFQLGFIVVHMPPYLAQHAISAEVSGAAVSAIGLFNVIGAYMSGVIGGRMQKRLPLSAIYVIRSLLITGFILIPVTATSTMIFAASMGLLWLSTVPLTMGLVTVMFGTRYMATLYGFVFVSHQLGSFLGIWLGGVTFDRVGSYDLVWWIGVALGIFAALINLPIREFRLPRFAAA
jgi:MFS family permease